MIGWLGAVTCALALYRIARILPADKIAAPLRDRLDAWAWILPGEPNYPDDEAERRARGAYDYDEQGGATLVPVAVTTRRAYVSTLLTCALCTGVWLAFPTYALFRWGGSVGRAIVTVLAIAGAQCYLANREEGD